jgi:HD-GYP domain-containing protein (c-di-GMP phosphodiesterase class II)
MECERRVTAGEALWRSALKATTAAALEAPDADSLADSVALALLEELDAEGCAALRVSAQTPALSAVLAAGVTPRVSQPDVPLESVPGRVAGSGEPARSEGTPDEPGIRSRVCVPLAMADGQMGALEIVNKRGEGGFSDEDLAAAEAGAAALAWALKQRTEWSRHAREVQRLEALVSIGQLLRRESALERVLESLLKVAQDLVGAEAGFCLLFRGQGETLVVTTAVGRGAEGVRGREIPAAESVEGAAASADGPVIVPTVASEARQSVAQLLDFPVRDLLCVPLRSSDEAYGVIELANSPRVGGFGGREARLLGDLISQAVVAVRGSADVERLKRSFLLTVECLSTAFDTPSPDAQNHPQRVVPVARGVAEKLELPALEREVVVLAALLHDMGKIAIDQQLLREPRELTDGERTVVRGHPLIAAQFLEPLIGSHLGGVVDALRHHHEWVDGRGYPDGLQGDQIPIASRVLAAVHAFCAITEGRPYQSARTPQEAVDELRRWSGTQFDPQVVEAIVSMASV